MAKNLRAKMPEEDTLLIHDRDTAATTKFLQEIATSSADKGLRVEMLASPREVAERSVSTHLPPLPNPSVSLLKMMSMFYQ